jgi:hypothetical protein
MAVSDTYVGLIRAFADNYSTFADDYFEGLKGVAAQEQIQLAQQIQETSDRRLAGRSQAAADAFARASETVKKMPGK